MTYNNWRRWVDKSLPSYLLGDCHKPYYIWGQRIDTFISPYWSGVYHMTHNSCGEGGVDKSLSALLLEGCHMIDHIWGIWIIICLPIGQAFITWPTSWGEVKVDNLCHLIYYEAVTWSITFGEIELINLCLLIGQTFIKWPTTAGENELTISVILLIRKLSQDLLHWGKMNW